MLEGVPWAASKALNRSISALAAVKSWSWSDSDSLGVSLEGPAVRRASAMVLLGVLVTVRRRSKSCSWQCSGRLRGSVRGLVLGRYI